MRVVIGFAALLAIAVFAALAFGGASGFISRDYQTMRVRAIREGRPLIVHVGYSPRWDVVRATPECLHVHVGQFPGVESSGLVVLRPRVGQLWRVADLPAWASVRDVQRAVERGPWIPPPPAPPCPPWRG